MKLRMKTIVSLALLLCFAAALFSVSASAANGQVTLVIVDQSRITAEQAAKIVPAEMKIIERVLSDTQVCPETQEMLRSDDGEYLIAEAIIHPGNDGLTAVTLLSDGNSLALPGHAVIEGKGEFCFGGENKALRTMQFGFVKEGTGDKPYRFYSTATVQICYHFLGGLAAGRTFYIDGKAYDIDENGYLSLDDAHEVDPELKASYVRATYFDGVPATYPYKTNPFILQEHIFDYSRVAGSSKGSCIEQGAVYYACRECGIWKTVETGNYGPHQWGNWVLSADGTMLIRVCDLCKAIETTPAPTPTPAPEAAPAVAETPSAETAAPASEAAAETTATP